MASKPYFVACTAWMFAISGVATADDYFVSSAGSDEALGTLAEPFATIQRAADVMLAGDTCYVRGGIYRETVTLPLSGTAEAPIRFLAYTNETVTVTGLDLVSGWTVHSGSIYRCTVPSEVSQLFADGELMVEARWPNTDTDYFEPTLASVDSATTGSYEAPISLTDSALSSFSNGFWDGAKLWYLPGSQWGSGSSTITTHSGNQLNFLNTSRRAALQIESGSKYFLYGTLNALDAATEWFYGAGQLYFQAPGDVDPSTLVVEARTRIYGFDLGSHDFVEIDGLKFKAATIKVEGSNCLVENCTILYPTPFFDSVIWKGGYGVELHGQNNTIRQCEIAWSWGDGVSLKNASISNTVENCLIHDCNWAGGWSAPIRTLGTGHALLNNTIYNSGRSGIRFQQATNLRIEHNHISHMGWLTKDLGAVKTGGTNGLGTVIAYNWLRDHNSDAWCTGVYLDNNSSNYLVHHNAAWNFDNGMRMNLATSDVQAYNNTFFNSSRESMAQYAPDGEVLSNILTYNNIGTTGPFRGTDLQNNLQATEANFDFSGAAHGDFRILGNSTAIDYAREIAGYTDGYVGAAPDAGAYEFGGTDWIAGIDWTPDWNALPVAAFTRNEHTFDASASTDADGFIMRYDWDFGDGTTGYGKIASHSYAVPGTYIVTLAVMDELHGISQTSNAVAVSLTQQFSGGTDLFLESDGTSSSNGTLLAGKPVSGTDSLDARRVFLQFDLSSIFGLPITQAVLRLYHIEGLGDTYGNAFLHAVTSDWTSGSVSFDQSVSASLGILVGNAGPFNQYHEFDISAVVQSWQVDPSSNHGFSIRGNEANGLTAKYFQSFEGVNPPEIIVTYGAPPQFTLSGSLTSSSELALAWESLSGATYSVERSFDLIKWTKITELIGATPPLNNYIDPEPVDSEPSVFYRITYP